MKKQPCGQREPSKQTFYNQSTCRNLLPFKEHQLPSCSATESPAVFATEVTTSSSCEVLRTKLTMMYSRSEPCRRFGGLHGARENNLHHWLETSLVGVRSYPTVKVWVPPAPLIQSGLQSMDSAHQDGLRVGANVLVPSQPAQRRHVQLLEERLLNWLDA